METRASKILSKMNEEGVSAKNEEEYATPPEFYQPMMDAWEKFRAAVRKAQPNIHRNYLSKVRELTKAMDGVTDALTDLGDEVDD